MNERHTQNQEETRFGDYVKQLRLERDLTLRVFAERINMDAGNYSKVERGLCDPPRDPAKLDQFCRMLCLDPDDFEWREIHRLAAINRGELPLRILANEQLMSKLPALFRSLEGETMNDAVLDELVALIKREM